MKAHHGAGMDAERAQLADTVKDMNAAQVKKINLLLSHNSPNTLIGALETLVALLRNHTSATNVDVELYF